MTKEEKFNKLYCENRGILITECNKARANLNAKDGNIVTMDDLMQEAMIALLKAMESFDEDCGVKFSTYLTTCVRNRVHDYCRKFSRSYSISQKANRLVCDCVALNDKGMSVDEIANVLDTDVATVLRALELNAGSISLDRKISDDGEETMERFLGYETPETNSEVDTLKKILEDEEPSEVKEMFCDFYGVNDREKLKMSDLVKKYSAYSESTIRRRIKSFEEVLFPKVKEQILADRIA